MDMPLQSTERGGFGQLHRAATVCLLLTSMGVIVGLTSPGLADTDLGVVDTAVHLPVVITTVVLYALVLSPVLTQPRKMLRGYRALAWFAPLISFCILSAAWSHSPMLSLRRSVFLALTTLTGLVLGTKYTLKELARMLGAASLIHLAIVGVLIFAAPHMVYSFADGHALRGLTTHKNVFGLEAGLAVLIFALVPFRRLSMLRWPLTAMAMAMLVLSHSAGSLVATVSALAVLPLLLPMRYRGMQRIALMLITVSVGVAMAFLLVENLQYVPQLLSKDSTLTGRTDLWALLTDAIAQRPFLGYGYDSFWMGLQGDSLTIIRAVGWLVPTAHNGYLDLLLGIGWVGMSLFVPLLLQGGRRAFHAVATEQGTARFFPAAFLVFWLVYNLNESALLTRSGLPFLLFVCIDVATAGEAPVRARGRAPLSPMLAPQFNL